MISLYIKCLFSRQKSVRFPVPISLREDLYDLVIVISRAENMGTISKPPVIAEPASASQQCRIFEECLKKRQTFHTNMNLVTHNL